MIVNIATRNETERVIAYGKNIAFTLPNRGYFTMGCLKGKTRNVSNALIFITCMSLILGLFLSSTCHAASKKEIDVSVDVALERFNNEIKGGTEFLKSARGVLVFPKIIKAGFVVGGEYGEGALRIGGKTVDYYSTVAGSFGFQIGAQAKTLILVFMEEKALTSFRKSEGWEVGVDGSVALVTIGAGGSIDTTNIKSPIVAFVFGQKGLMLNLTLEGSKFTKLRK